MACDASPVAMFIVYFTFSWERGQLVALLCQGSDLRLSKGQGHWIKSLDATVLSIISSSMHCKPNQPPNSEHQILNDDHKQKIWLPLCEASPPSLWPSLMWWELPLDLPRPAAEKVLPLSLFHLTPCWLKPPPSNLTTLHLICLFHMTLSYPVSGCPLSKLCHIWQEDHKNKNSKFLPTSLSWVSARHL